MKLEIIRLDLWNCAMGKWEIPETRRPEFYVRHCQRCALCSW